MCDDNNRQPHAAVDVTDECKDGLCRLRVECGGCLVAQQHLRIARECTRDADALLLSTREMARIVVRLVSEPDERKQLRNFWLDFTCGLARELQWKCDVVVDGRGGQQVEVLEDHADVTAFLAQLALAHFHQVASVYEHFAARRTLKHIDAADERGLARAREPDDAVDGAALDGEVDPAQRVDVSLVCFYNIF